MRNIQTKIKIIEQLFLTSLKQISRRCAFERIRADSNTISGLRILNLLSQSKTVKRSVTFYVERRGGLKHYFSIRQGQIRNLNF